MASTRDLKRRIRSVKGTQQITSAMKMVAAAKLRRAQQRMNDARPFAETLKRVMAEVGARTDLDLPLLAEREERHVWLVVITSDKGLCGAFNSNLLREAEKLIKSNRWEAVEVVAIGRKAAEFFNNRPIQVVHEERDTMSKLTVEDGERLGKMMVQAFSNAQIDACYVMSNHFVSMISQKVEMDRVLPLSINADEADPEHLVTDYIYEPEPKELLGLLLPKAVSTQITAALLESAAAEQAARMVAMESATKNANEMIDKLTLLYNRSRQAAITKELIEIVSGAKALEG